MPWAIAILAAYVVGSIPFGVIIGRARGIDIREHGSRNIGATNVMRVLGKGPGLLCFLLDVLKGAVPVLVAGAVTGVLGQSVPTVGDQLAWLGVAIAAVVGHMFSIFIGFRGGKGVATGFGGLVGMWPLLTIPTATALVVWIVTLKTTKYVSLSSMLAAASLPVSFAIALLVRQQPFDATWPPFAVTIALAALVAFRHRANIGRLRRGEEPKVGSSG